MLPKRNKELVLTAFVKNKLLHIRLPCRDESEKNQVGVHFGQYTRFPTATDTAITILLMVNRRWRPRFSLRTLLAAVLLIGSGGGLWWNWEPWAVSCSLNFGDEGLISASLSPDGKTGVTAILPYNDSFDFPHTFKIDFWDTNTAQRTATTLVSYRVSQVFPEGGDHCDLSFSADGTWIIARYGFDYQLRAAVLDVSGARDRCFSDQMLMDVAFSSDNKRFTLLYADRPAEIRDAADGKLLSTLEHANVRELKGREPKDYEVARISPEATRIVTFTAGVSSPDNEKVWDARTGRKLRDIEGFQIDSKHYCKLHDNVKISVKISDVEDPKMEDQTFAGELVPITNAISPDGLRLMTYTAKENAFSAWIWNLKAAQSIAKVEGTNPPPSYARGAWTDRNIALISRECCWIWNFATSKHVTIFGRSGVLFPNGTRLISVNGQDDATIWDADSGTKLAMMSGINAVWAVSNDGMRIMASNEHNAFVWKRRRPEYWWGLAWLPEFWLTVIFACAFVWSVWKDRRDMRARAATVLTRISPT